MDPLKQPLKGTLIDPFKGTLGFIPSTLWPLKGILELGAWTESADKEPGNFGDPAGLGQYTQASDDCTILQ